MYQTAYPATGPMSGTAGRSPRGSAASGAWRRAALPGAAALLVAAAACANGPAVDSPSRAPGPSSGEAELFRVRTLIGSAACMSDADCRVAGIGDRPCGGPEGHLAWSVRATDSEALSQALRAHADARRRWYEALGLSSTCEIRPPPDVACQGQPGRCTLVPRGSALR